jgi:sulfatase-modifying factor enzyme 1
VRRGHGRVSCAGQWSATIAVLFGCTSTEPAPASRASGPSTVPAKPVQAPDNSRAWIPEGSFQAGTEAGQFNRQPELEPRSYEVTLGAFEIDVLPYPGGGQPPQTGVSRLRAQELCAETGARLCTELEWERACKGPRSLSFASADEFDPACARAAAACASGFGVQAMGALREWTASDVEGTPEPRAAIRGANRGDAPEYHRCAHRVSAVALDLDTDVGFRCCHGAPNAARVKSPARGSVFTRHELPLSELAQLLANNELTSELARDVAYFEEPEAPARVLAKGGTDTQGFVLTTRPLIWSPVAGAEFLVVSARSGQATSFIVVYHVLGDSRYRLASSFIMQAEPGPIALGYTGHLRPRLVFSSCWGCPGETGRIVYRDPDQALILQP